MYIFNKRNKKAQRNRCSRKNSKLKAKLKASRARACR